MEDADQSAIYEGETTRWTADIYDQSIFYQAARDLAQWSEAVSSKNKAGFWRERAESVRRNADKWLWQNSEGFYRVHIHLGAWSHDDLDESLLFAMGGNAQAIISGLAGEPGDAKRSRIIEQALSRQKKFGVSTISGTILPPSSQGILQAPGARRTL